MKRKGEWLEIELPKAVAESEGDWEAYVRDATGMTGPFWLRMAKRGDVERAGRFVRLRLFPPREPGFAPQYVPIEILYEDDHCLVVNKPAGMAVHPAQGGQTGTLANAVAFHYEATGQLCAVRHIHRLDEQTSGAVLYAKNELAQHNLDAAMRDKRIERVYVAVVRGTPARRQGTIDAPIGRDRHVAGKRRVSPTGDSAITHYTVSESFAQCAILELRLATGRTHQIRVHLQHIGYPIIGDPLYGAPDSRIDRQALHGRALYFDHPLSKEPLVIEAGLPSDMIVLLDELRAKNQSS